MVYSIIPSCYITKLQLCVLNTLISIFIIIGFLYNFCVFYLYIKNIVLSNGPQAPPEWERDQLTQKRLRTPTWPYRKGLRGKRFSGTNAPWRQDVHVLKGGRQQLTQRWGGHRGSVRQRRAADPICHPLSTSEFQFPGNSTPSSALRKEGRFPVGLAWTAAERTGVREPLWVVSLGGETQLRYI